MSRAGRVRGVAVRLSTGVLLAVGALLTVPQPASACAVGIGYRPQVDMDDVTHHRTCSAGTSAIGVAGVAVLTLGALAGAGVLVLRRGERATGAGPAALDTYLAATGVIAPTSATTWVPPRPADPPAGGAGRAP